ncbi:MAG TPA: NUDIX hydrolase [Polyangiaceae bacterium]|nr:NUDIX hydrolase [Polyangiaceae bacterium]
MTNQESPLKSEATLVDRGFQLAYLGAYRLMRAYWKVRHPTTHGTLVAMWNSGDVLLVRNSYVPYYSLPGGYVRRGETPKEAALRELKEEVGVSALSEQLDLVLEETNDWEGKRDHVLIFSIELSSRPTVNVDHREVIDAAWWSPDRALAVTLFPPLRRVIERRIAGNRGG